MRGKVCCPSSDIHMIRRSVDKTRALSRDSEIGKQPKRFGRPVCLSSQPRAGKTAMARRSPIGLRSEDDRLPNYRGCNRLAFFVELSMSLGERWAPVAQHSLDELGARS